MSLRAQRAKQAAELRARGLLYREIAQEMGISTSYVAGLLRDPSGELDKARKASYASPCRVCGGPTDGSDGRKRQTQVCRSCRTWTREAILAAFARWMEEHDKPPTVLDFARTASYPSPKTVHKMFGSWNEGLLAAGLPITMDRRESTQQWIEAELRSGREAREIAEELGCTVANIYERCKTRGTSVAALRGKAVSRREPEIRSVRLRRLVSEGGQARRVNGGWEVQMPDGKLVTLKLVTL